MITLHAVLLLFLATLLSLFVMASLSYQLSYVLPERLDVVLLAQPGGAAVWSRQLARCLRWLDMGKGSKVWVMVAAGSDQSGAEVVADPAKWEMVEWTPTGGEPATREARLQRAVLDADAQIPDLAPDFVFLGDSVFPGGCDVRRGDLFFGDRPRAFNLFPHAAEREFLQGLLFATVPTMPLRRAQVEAAQGQGFEKLVLSAAMETQAVERNSLSRDVALRDDGAADADLFAPGAAQAARWADKNPPHFLTVHLPEDGSGYWSAEGRAALVRWLDLLP